MQPGCAGPPPEERVAEPSGTNADDRLARASLSRIEGGDGIIESREVADVPPQSSVPHPPNEVTQLGAIGLDTEFRGTGRAAGLAPGRRDARRLSTTSPTARWRATSMGVGQDHSAGGDRGPRAGHHGRTAADDWARVEPCTRRRGNALMWLFDRRVAGAVALGLAAASARPSRASHPAGRRAALHRGMGDRPCRPRRGVRPSPRSGGGRPASTVTFSDGTVSWGTRGPENVTVSYPW